MDRLAALYEQCGQSPWLDNLKRSYVTGGELRRQIQRGIRGLTSNPTIFQKAIQGSTDYDDQFREMVAGGGSTIDHYWALVLQDIHGALEQFAPLYQASSTCPKVNTNSSSCATRRPPATRPWGESSWASYQASETSRRASRATQVCSVRKPTRAALRTPMKPLSSRRSRTIRPDTSSR